ncbi:hypothetical protein JOF29_007125 [Kribbella aluminosa]|uniref:Uncharacterized protein n=1 Tax=Kribbella aluminosa TaxID=416017 RepID=A0ABS4UWI7_9ACTN|nr:hypothetical protein [Kribbella aluminosa]MBP2356015.1 hypothetical protein [Kribbella aluminosa]
MNVYRQHQTREECCPPGAEYGKARRTIGPWGTAARLVAAAGGLAWAVVVPHEHPLLDLPGASSDAVGLLVGLVVAPIVLTLAALARGRSAPRLQLGHGAACAVTVLVVGVAQFYPAATLMTVSAPLVLLAALGRNGCELLAVPNLVLRRDDYLFCLPFSPLDAWERRHQTTASRAGAGIRTE